MMAEHKRLTQINEDDPLAPLVGRNLISVVLTDLVNIFYKPGVPSLIAAAMDLATFFVMPFLGGYLNATV